MTLVNIDLRNQGYETGPDDRVVFYSLLVREGDFGTISTAPVEVELADGQATVDLAPGPVGVQILAKQVADTRVKIGEVPPSGPTTLNAVMMVTPAYTPALQKMMIAAIERAKEIAVGQVDAEVAKAVNAEVGEFKTKAEQALTKSTAAESKSDTALAKSTTAESSAGNAVSRVSALEAMSGLSPESPADGQTANLIAQSGTLTRAAVAGATSVSLGSVSVKDFGAQGDGAIDDTVSIQAAIDHIATRGGGVVVVPDGTYMIRGHVDNPKATNFLRDEGGIALKDNIHLSLSPGAVLKAIPNDKRAYEIVRAYDKKNVTITGGTIQGERHEHTGTGGEYGYGIAISGGENITIRDVTIRDCWGDGINLQRIVIPSGTNAPVPVNVNISGVTCTGNRRQGMSVEGAIGLRVTDSIFEKTGGTPPSAGVDIEPFNQWAPIEDMVFTRCIFRDNASWGMLAMQPQLDGLTIQDCIFDGNKAAQGQLEVYSEGKGVRVEGCEFRNTDTDNNHRAMWIRAGGDVSITRNSTDSVVQVGRMNPEGISNVTISDNRISSPHRHTVLNGVLARNVDQGRIERNSISGGNIGINLEGSRFVRIVGNEVVNSTVGVQVGQGYTDRTCMDVTVEKCLLIDNGGFAASASHTDAFTFRDNTVRGASHLNLDRRTLILYSTLANARVEGNTFYSDPVGSDTGQYRGQWVLSIASAPDTFVSGNVVVGEGYALWSGNTAPSTGYVGDRAGMMVCPTSARPTAPAVGTQVFDRSLSKIITWSGTSWVDTMGSPV